MHIQEILGFYLNEGLGASTKPNSKQPLERTVIELRYGLNILEPQYIEDAKKYIIKTMYRIMSEETDKTFMNEMISSIINELKKKKNVDKIKKNVLKPLLKDVSDKFYPYIITVFSMLSSIIVLLITLIVIECKYRKNT